MSQVPPSGTPRPAAKPPLVMGAAIALFVAGGFAVLGGLLAFGFAGFGGLIVILALLSLALGAVSIWAGFLTLNQRAQGRQIGMVVSIVGVVLGLLSLIQGQFLAILYLLAYGFAIYVFVTQPAEFNR
jgi:hypothetical protein